MHLPSRGVKVRGLFFAVAAICRCPLVYRPHPLNLAEPSFTANSLHNPHHIHCICHVPRVTPRKLKPLQELEGMENEQAEEWNPFEMDDEDDPATASGITRLSTPASSPRKARKRPRSETTLPPATPFSTPPSGQWAKDLRGDGDEGDFALSGTGDSWRGVSLGRSPTSQRSLQVRHPGITRGLLCW